MKTSSVGSIAALCLLPWLASCGVRQKPDTTYVAVADDEHLVLINSVGRNGSDAHGHIHVYLKSPYHINDKQFHQFGWAESVDCSSKIDRESNRLAIDESEKIIAQLAAPSAVPGTTDADLGPYKQIICLETGDKYLIQRPYTAVFKFYQDRYWHSG